MFRLILFLSALTALSAQASSFIPAASITLPKLNSQVSDPRNIRNCTIATSVGSSALTITLKDAAGSTPTALSPCRISFRNATAATGTYSSVDITAATSVVISSGSTLGCVSAVACSVYVYAINNAGTVVLAAGEPLLDAGSVQSSTAEGGAGAADSNQLIYSTAAQSSKAVRLLARLTVTEATAGTWASNVTEISDVPFEIKTPSASYSSTAGNSFSSGIDTTLSFSTKAWDTHGAYSSGSGTYTCPETGKFQAHGKITFVAFNSAGNNGWCQVLKNGSTYKIGPITEYAYSGSVVYSQEVTAVVDCTAGDTIAVQCRNGTVGTQTLSTTAGTNYVEFFKVSN
jgi:hypothetical protein